jgi:hypothetical protein
MNILSERLLTTTDEDGESQYTAVLNLSYGSVVPFNFSYLGITFVGNTDLFQMQSLMSGIKVAPIRHVQLTFILPQDIVGGPGNLFLFMPDTGQLISAPLTDTSDFLPSVSFSVDILPSYQVQIMRTQNNIAAINGIGVLCLSTRESQAYWSA